MSIKVMSQVWEHSHQKGSRLLTLIAIADYANDEGDAYPSIASIVKKTRMSERTVQSVLRDLEVGGELHIERNAGPKRCHLYRILAATIEQKSPRKDCTPQRLHPADFASDPANSAPNPSLDPSLDLDLNKNLDLDHARTRKKVLAYSAGFTAFWQAYPDTRKRGKAEAWKIWQRRHLELQADDIVVKIRALRQYDRDFREGFEPEPRSWLAKERYADDLLTGYSAARDMPVSAATARSMAVSQGLIEEIEGGTTGESPIFRGTQQHGRTLLGSNERDATTRVLGHSQ